jgi:chitin disaccharide deacetylase
MSDRVNQSLGEPWPQGRIVICADDYGADEGTSAVIRELLQAGRLDATSCLVEAEGWPAAAQPLARLARRKRSLEIGLHLNLTERLPNTGDPDVIAPISRHIARAVLPAPVERIDAFHAAFRAQWEVFIGAFGRAPDFVDGHEHVHLFPGPRTAFFALLDDVGFKGWVRQCATSSKRGNWKRMLLDPASRDFTACAATLGLTVNPGFGGLRHFDPREDMAALWREDLAAMREAGGVLMTHPGAVSADRAGQCRAQEAALLAAAALAAP